MTNQASSLEDLWNAEDRYSALAGSAIGSVRPTAKRFSLETLEKIGLRKLEDAYNQITIVEQQYRDGLLRDGERFDRLIDIWTYTNEEIWNASAKSIHELPDRGVESLPINTRRREALKRSARGRSNKPSDIKRVDEASARSFSVEGLKSAIMKALAKRAELKTE